MATLVNKRIYIIKERASRERHTEKNTDLCSVRENKNILQGRQTLYSYLQTLIYSLPVPTYLCLIVLEGTSIIENKVSWFDQFKTKSLQTRWNLRTTNIVSMKLTNILTV